MAQKLSIIIGLEGGKQLQQDLLAIGAAGQKAFDDIVKAAEKAGTFQKMDPEKLAAKFGKASKLSVDEINKIQRALEGAIRTEQAVKALKAIEDGFVSAGREALRFAGISRSLQRVAAALGPIGIAAGLLGVAFAAIVKVASDAAQSIGKVEEAAAKVGLSIEKYDRLRAALQKVGISSDDAAGAIQKISDAVDKAKIEQVAASFKKLQEVMATGSDPRTSQAFRTLTESAQGFGPVADAAKKAMADLGIQLTVEEQRLQRMASSGTQSLAQLAGGFRATAPEISAYSQGVANLAAGTGTAEATLRAFIVRLEGISDPAERNAFAFREMGKEGLEISRAINTGALSSKQSIEELTKGVTLLDQNMANTAASIDQSMNKVASTFERLRDTGIAQVWDNFASAGSTAINTVSGAMDGLLGKLREAVALVNSLGGAAPAGSLPGHASGGLLGGRGSGTSDSNLAWVSRGEHIMPAGAVRQPGVLAFLEALRRSGGDLSRVLDRMGHFATGGLVGMPSFAAGGGVGGMSHVTIAFPGLPAISGLRASSAVVEELQRAAALAQVRSGGRKPSRYS